MRRLFLISVLLFVLPGELLGSQAGFSGIQLLEGYSAKQLQGTDTADWTIEGKGGFKIYFETGYVEGSTVNPEEREKYSWYREQKINGCDGRFALIKPGIKTLWELGDDRHLPPGNILLVTFFFEPGNRFHTATFSAKIANSEELADALLMITTFDPSEPVAYTH